MSDRFVKPGNQQHGWNDPPQFSYGLQKDSGGLKRNILNKRVHALQFTDSGSEMQSPPVTRLTPPRGMNPLMDSSTPPSVCPKTPSGGKMEVVETEPSIEDVQEPLHGALNACRHTVKKQICDDVERRLKLS
ncbi:steroid receptor RNA activator 1-like [Sinocyclocheilus anshuiensis]|uniref:steroid receptor RNA activator 1-like n=1 Tax=Sinocyclocheilus anshuiensis TaxID=1608454 RepID=UPI0007B8235B|nr:PREDICTED: steroid receptor RNA activator 1-like [Sinocyclocheilus anshuiensis]